MELHIQLHGDDSNDVAGDMSLLADVLDIFNNVDDDEILRLHQQANAITSQEESSSSVNVAVGLCQLGNAYKNRSKRAEVANDLNRCVANLELALSHFREATRIFRVNNHMDKADAALREIAMIEENIRKLESARAATSATKQRPGTK